MKKCDACDRQLGGKESGFGVYRCVSYPNHFTKKPRGAYMKNIHPDDVGAKYNVMLCCSCQDKNKEHIDIPNYIQKEQHEKWLWLRLTKR